MFKDFFSRVKKSFIFSLNFISFYRFFHPILGLTLKI